MKKSQSNLTFNLKTFKFKTNNEEYEDNAQYE